MVLAVASGLLAARHQACFISVSCTQTTVATRYWSAVTKAPRKTRARPAGRGTHLAIGRGHRDVATEADDVVELQLLAQHPVELLIAKPAIGHDAHRDVCRQGFSQADKHLIFKFIAVVLEGGFIHREPHQRGSPAVSGQQREHDRGLAVGVELGPIQGHVDIGARSHDVANPVAQRGVDIDPMIGQQPIHLLDRMLGHKAARQSQALSDRIDRQGGGLDDAERGVGQ
jgi:hypothetical protein